MIVTDGRAWPPRRLAKWRHRLWDSLRTKSVRRIAVVDSRTRYYFRCQNLWEYQRCAGMFRKEPGTCAWITEQVRPGEVFFDIGANIGIYTILAAQRVGESGAVYAFEPHGATFARLLENIIANQLQTIVRPCNFALHDEVGFFPFNYQSNVSGTSNSQLATRRGATEALFDPTITEVKYATSIDALCDEAKVRPPHHVKIDVDGNEMKIIRGMGRLLSGSERPRSIQVEMNQRDKSEIEPFLNGSGYALACKHYSRTAEKKIARGEDPEAYAYNAIFEPAAS